MSLRMKSRTQVDFNPTISSRIYTFFNIFWSLFRDESRGELRIKYQCFFNWFNTNSIYLGFGLIITKSMENSFVLNQNL